VLIVISVHRWGRDLGSANGEGYDVESYGQWLRDGGKRLEKKNHTAM
jgi:hypothetical protein